MFSTILRAPNLFFRLIEDLGRARISADVFSRCAHRALDVRAALNRMYKEAARRNSSKRAAARDCRHAIEHAGGNGAFHASTHH